jgi:hypothetical protein
MMWAFLIAGFTVGSVILYGLGRAYVVALLRVGRFKPPSLRNCFALGLYLAFAGCLVLPLFLALRFMWAHEYDPRPWSTLLPLLALYVISVYPAFRYIFRKRIADLQAVGFYLSGRTRW